MGMFGSGPIPVSAASAAYQPSKMDIFLQTLFGHGSPADAADHLRELRYQQDMRPIQAQLYRDAVDAYGTGGSQSAQSQTQGQDTSTPPPADLPTAMGNGLGQAIGTVPQYGQPLVPQINQPSSGGIDLTDPRTQRRIMLGSMVKLPAAQTELEIGKATVPHMIAMPDGTVIRDNDASQAGRVYRKAPVDGAIPSAWDGAGNVTDWRLPAGVNAIIDKQQAPAMLRGIAAVRAARTGEGQLGLARTDSANYAPPPGFSAKPPQKRK